MCEAGKKEKPVEGSVLSHMWLIELLQTESLRRWRPTSLCLMKQQVADKQEENLKGTEAFGCKLTLDIKHLTLFYFLGETRLKHKPYVCTSKCKSFL